MKKSTLVVVITLAVVLLGCVALLYLAQAGAIDMTKLHGALPVVSAMC